MSTFGSRKEAARSGCQQMGKKKGKPATDAPASEPFQSAFSGLASLRADLPSFESPDPGPQPGLIASPGTSTAETKLVLQREKKGRGGKTVTRLLGLPTPDARAYWTAKLKKELGCGATIEGDDVILLGDVGARAETRLEAGGFRRIVRGN